MTRFKLSTTIFSTAALVACVPATYVADQDDDDRDIVCAKEASIASHIKDDRCRFTGGIASESDRSDGTLDDGPFQTIPVTVHRSADQSPLPSAVPPLPPEGKCGGQIPK